MDRMQRLVIEFFLTIFLFALISAVPPITETGLFYALTNNSTLLYLSIPEAPMPEAVIFGLAVIAGLTMLKHKIT
jgi:hypothetical protein